MTGDMTTETENAAPAGAALIERLRGIAAPRRFLKTLGDGHYAAFAQGNHTLVVTFELADDIAARGDDALPLGHRLRADRGWSALSLFADQRDWFRADTVYGLFDDLSERGLFDAFDRVLFYGAGPCAHAACAFSVSAPGATVIAIAPQASLGATRAAFDTRFPEARRLDFTSRFGYAPDMLDGADEAHIFYDPAVVEDAAHAAQFNRPHIRLHRLPHFGQAPQDILDEGGMLTEIFALYDADTMTPARIGRALRNRRTTRSYLLGLSNTLSEKKRDYLNALMCNNVGTRMGAPRFRRRAEQLAAQLAERGVTLPFSTEAAAKPEQQPEADPANADPAHGAQAETQAAQA